MKAKLGYAPKDSAFPSLGLNVLEPSSQANTNSSPAFNNFAIIKGLPQKRLGFWQLGSTFSDQVIGVFEFEDLDGQKTLLAITSKHQYKLDTTTDPPTWQSISWSTPWTGGTSDFLDVCVAVGKNSGGAFAKWVIITNGLDRPLYWDGVASTFQPYAPDITDFATYRSMRSFFNKLVMANLTTTLDQGQLYGWSADQELLDFTDDTNGAGAAIVPGVQGQFVRVEQLRDRLVLYSENSIALVTFVGGIVILNTEISANETRLVAGRSVVNLGPYHLFLSQENIFLFDGTSLVRTMGDAIFRQYRNELAVNRIFESFGFHDAARQQVFFTIPVGVSDHATYVLDYNLQDLQNWRWTRQSYAQMPTAMGTWSRTSTLTWDSNWAQTTQWRFATSPWDQGSTKIGFPVRILACGTKVFVADETVSTDGGSTIVATWDTIDYTVPGEFLSSTARWLEIEFEAIGSACNMYYSMDGGRNFTLAGNTTLTGAWTKYKFPIDITGSRIRLRFENSESDGSLSFDWNRVWFRAGGPA